MTRLLISLEMLFILSAAAFSQEIIIPQIPGIKITRGETMVIPGATNTIAMQFADGRIVVIGEKDKGAWSTDGGNTWTEGPRGPESKTAIDIGGGEIIAFGSKSTQPVTEETHEASLTRSLDNWATRKSEKISFHMPLAAGMQGEEKDKYDGMIIHHGALKLKNGDLMITLYGNYQGDTEIADAYPVEFNMRKYRTIVVTSSDMGKTWKNPTTVAYNTMLGRGLDPDSNRVSYRAVPAVTQEGFCEADLARAPNGDIICMMRSGGRIPVGKAQIFPTPLYLSRSSDEGKSWSTPMQVADRGVCPYLAVLKNGIMVCSYARPGQWLIFSDDNAETWKGAFQFAEGNDYLKVLAVAPDRILVIHKVNGEVRGTFFTVTRAS